MKFETIWHARKADIDSDSVERDALFGTWRLYISYVDPVDSRWRTDVMTAPSPDAFKPSQRVKVSTAADIDVKGVKDPVVYLIGGLHYAILVMRCRCAPSRQRPRRGCTRQLTFSIPASQSRIPVWR